MTSQTSFMFVPWLLSAGKWLVCMVYITYSIRAQKLRMMEGFGARGSSVNLTTPYETETSICQEEQTNNRPVYTGSLSVYINPLFRGETRQRDKTVSNPLRTRAFVP
ncbi:hypothetical protein F4677DRAFT_378497 [Hypoxylon crocopeplum]|nr:hypothetical protein F4677DRAFT_378497 [Hypoxylon crocopeplum]